MSDAQQLTTAAAAAEFPSAGTVPFPFDSPYDVQRELMAAILDALRQCQAEGEAGDAVVGNCDSPKGPSRTRRAPIIMLESPTGTGKSLSLACASMAWLTYRESADMNDLLPTSPREDEMTEESAKPPRENAPNPNSRHAPKKYDWIEAWQPPSDEQSKPLPTTVKCATPSPTAHTNNQADRQREQMRTFAVENRAALKTELGSIRARLERLVNVASFNDAPRQAQSVRDQERTLRENLVRSGVASAMAKEKKLKRQLARSGTVVNRGIKRRKAGSGPSGEDEFLLDAYHSDDDALGNVSSDSDDDDTTALNDLANKERSKNPQLLSAKALLAGSNLDGSGYRNDPERNARSTAWNDASITTEAVGGVSAGSGVRKVIYAARTHSQLSQFVSELRRTHWGKDVKVVALGSRSLLCSNEGVLYSSKSTRNRRSEAEITEMCLDMQKSKKGGAKRTSDGDERVQKAKNKSSCPFHSSSEAISTLALHSLVRPSDIEDLASLGKASHTCSYYGEVTYIVALSLQS